MKHNVHINVDRGVEPYLLLFGKLELWFVDSDRVCLSDYLDGLVFLNALARPTTEAERQNYNKLSSN